MATTAKQLRIEKGMTQEELANAAKVSLSLVQKIENGTKNIDAAAYGCIAAIARVLGVSTDEYANAVRATPKRITGLKNALYLYNTHGSNPEIYGYLMLDRKTGKVWTDEFTDRKGSSWISYKSAAIVNLGKCMEEAGYRPVWEITDDYPLVMTYTEVKTFAEKMCAQYSAEQA